ncbi:ABC transporter permease subunit [Agromyces ramosus]|uniref:ABC-2 type transport system permease protein n=1 Tax=Agromyces ramosus TaxID=33879 RepID=A0ABU0RC94_9MICO|nr:ABC transporter permease subunit [Agromyces ramosus]MDQ0895688.1 ABC-2 type transport system permease protein [Agromyces ramosus]
MNRVLPLFRRTLADSWRGLAGWTAGVVATLLLYLPIYPSFGGNGQMQELVESLPPELVRTIGYDQISTGAGYAQSTFFGLVGFVLLTIAAVGWGTGAIANDEENGQLELTLAHGVTRGQVLAERSAAVLVKLAWLALVAVVTVLALNEPSELGIEVGPLVATSAALVGLSFLSAAAAIAVGAIAGRRSWALGAGAGIAVYGYVMNALSNQSDDLDGLHDWSPYAWAFGSEPLTNGWDWRIWLLYAVAAVLLVIGWIVFRRRDVAV